MGSTTNLYQDVDTPVPCLDDEVNPPACITLKGRVSSQHLCVVILTSFPLVYYRYVRSLAPPFYKLSPILQPLTHRAVKAIRHMSIPPLSSPVPRPEQLFMSGISYQVEAPTSSSSSATPTSTPLPLRRVQDGSDGDAGASADDKKILPAAEFPLPKLRLEIRNLAHPGASLFLSSVNAAELLSRAAQNVLRHLYVAPPPDAAAPATGADSSSSSSKSPFRAPPTRSVTVILRDLGGGVAYTTGSELDDDHKEIHVHLGYVAGQSAARAAAEIDGVLTHELVHCLQWSARDVPGGLIEGVADWVRLRCGLAPPHWQRPGGGSGSGHAGDRWDQGYQHTAYFLAYLEDRFGDDAVRRINDTLRTVPRYDEKPFWTGLLGRPVDQLWEDYKESLKN
jgi:hypothetical protein